MTIERTEVVWLEARSDYTAHDLAVLSGLPQPLLDDLIECGALPGEQGFAAECVVLARAARRLHEHFELDHQGLAVAVSLLRRVRSLEAQLVDTRARATTLAD